MQVQKYRRRLELLAEGRLVEAMQVQTGGSSATAKAVDGMQDAGGRHKLMLPHGCTAVKLCLHMYTKPLSGALFKALLENSGISDASGYIR